jgi:hypothetical protein
LERVTVTGWEGKGTMKARKRKSYCICFYPRMTEWWDGEKKELKRYGNFKGTEKEL